MQTLPKFWFAKVVPRQGQLHGGPKSLFQCYDDDDDDITVVATTTSSTTASTTATPRLKSHLGFGAAL